jgi:hypothetical protein
MAVTPGISQEMSGAQNPAYRRASHFSSSSPTFFVGSCRSAHDPPVGMAGTIWGKPV